MWNHIITFRPVIIIEVDEGLEGNLVKIEEGQLLILWMLLVVQNVCILEHDLDKVEHHLLRALHGLTSE